jgi:predicted signal transduction protein with EAL and GGDEF domain
VQFASRIRESVDRMGGEGAMLARFGGDEFVILIESVASPTGNHGDVRMAASRLAETLVAELSRPIVVRDRQVFLGTSIGITLFPEDASGSTMLMKNGDIAMYQAKVAGKNCYRFYSRAMDQAVERRVRMEQDLRGAWERGELSLAYQPVYSLADGQLVGAAGAARRVHGHGALATGTCRGRAHVRLGQRIAAATAQRGPAAHGGRLPARYRARSVPVAPGTDRDRGDRR